MSFGRNGRVSALSLVIAAAAAYVALTLWLTRGAVPLPPDTVQYAEVARSLVRGLGYTVNLVAFHPGYYPAVRHVPELHGLLQPLLLAPLFALLGPELSLARVPGLLFVSLLSVVSFRLARSLFGTLAGLFAAGWILSSGIFLFMAILGADDVGAALFSTVAVLGFVEALRTENLRWLVLAGLGAGLATLEKLTGVLLPVALGAALVAVPSARRVVGARGFATVAAPALVAAGVYLLRNHLVHGGLGFRFGPIDWASKDDPLRYFAFYERAPTTLEIWEKLGSRRLLQIVADQGRLLAAGIAKEPGSMIGGPLALVWSLRRKPAFAAFGLAYVAAVLAVVCLAYHFEPRYLSVLEPLYAVALGGVAAAALETALALGPASWHRGIRAAGVAVLAALLGRAVLRELDIGGSTIRAGHLRDTCPGMADYVRAHVGPTDVVLTTDPGFVAWELDRPAVTAPSNYETSLVGVIQHYRIAWAHVSPRALGTTDVHAALTWLARSGSGIEPQLGYGQAECSLFELVRASP